MSLFKRVTEFHEAFGQPVSDSDMPQPIAADRMRLRLNLILEEVAEVVDAFCDAHQNVHMKATHKSIKQAIKHLNNASDYELMNYDLAHLAKELSDVRVVVYGTDVELGIDADRVDEEVMDSNMSKLGEDGKPITNEMGKVLKGPNFKEVDLDWVNEYKVQEPE